MITNHELLIKMRQVVTERDMAVAALEEIASMAATEAASYPLAYKRMPVEDIARIFVIAKRAISRVEASCLHFRDVERWLLEEVKT